MLKVQEGLEIVRPANLVDLQLREALQKVDRDASFKNNGSYMLSLLDRTDYQNVLAEVNPPNKSEFQKEVEDFVERSMGQLITSRFHLRTTRPQNDNIATKGKLVLRIGEVASEQLESERKEFYSQFDCENLFNPADHDLVVVRPIGDENTQALRSKLIATGLVNRQIVIQPAMPVAILPSHQF